MILPIILLSLIKWSTSQSLYQMQTGTYQVEARKNQKLLIEYFPKDEVLDIHLEPIIDHQKNNLGRRRFRKYRHNLLSFCKPIDRQLKEIQLTEMLQAAYTQGRQIRSVVQLNDTIYLVLDNLMIHKVQINEVLDQDNNTKVAIDYKIEIDDLRNDSISNCQNCQKLLVDNIRNDRVYLYTKYNLYYIHDFVIKDMGNNQLKVRDNVYKPFIFNNVLFTACGVDGIDIHVQNEQATFEFERTIRIDELAIKEALANSVNNTDDISIDIRDIHISEKGLMHILCHNTGFHSYRFDVDNLKILNRVAFIDIEKGIKFRANDHLNIIFVIGTRPKSNNYYVSEIVHNGQQYIVNRQYQQPQEYYDIQFGDNFSLIVGRDIHQVLFHQTSRDIIPNDEKVSGFIVKKDVKYLKLLKLEQKDVMLVVTNNYVRLFWIQQIFAQIECYGDQHYISTDYNYKATIYTRNCQKKKNMNDSSALSACKITHGLEVYLNAGNFTSQDTKYILLIIACVTVLLILVFVLIFRIYSRYKNRLVSDLQDQVDKFKNIKYQQLQVNDESQEQTQTRQNDESQEPNDNSQNSQVSNLEIELSSQNKPGQQQQ